MELAIQFYQKALSLDPNFLIAKNNLAIALTDMGTHVKNQGNVKLGVQYYKKALVYNVQYADAYYNLGVAYGEQSRFDRAIFYYQLAIFANPVSSRTRRTWISILLTLSPSSFFLVVL